jgi:hypothetical protein
MNQPIRTPPIPHRMVSQIGVLSLLPGATNLPSNPMMIPATITPMISTVHLPSEAKRCSCLVIHYARCTRRRMTQTTRSRRKPGCTRSADRPGTRWRHPARPRPRHQRANWQAIPYPLDGGPRAAGLIHIGTQAVQWIRRHPVKETRRRLGHPAGHVLRGWLRVRCL